MILTLLAVSLNDQPLTRPITARFDSHGGTIGRADHSTLSLPDPERVISRKQAEVVFMGDGFMIRNLGAANPITVAGRMLVQGETAPLREADEVRIGGYLLRAQFDTETDVVLEPPAPAAALRTPTRPGVRTAEPVAYVSAPAPALSSSNPFADLLGSGAPASDDLGGLLGPAPAASAPANDPFHGMMAAPAGLGSRSAATAAPPAPAASVLPDDFDPFAVPAPRPAPPAPGWAASAPSADPSANPFADLTPDVGAPSLDAAFGLDSGAAGDDALARFTAGMSANPGSQGGISTDPLQLFGGAPAPTPGAAPQRDDLPAIHAPYSPPRAQAPIPTVSLGPAPSGTAAPVMTGPSIRPTVGGGVEVEGEVAMWQAFCEGAGVNLTLPPGRGAERMRNIGRVLRNAADGTLQLMAVRASTKHEMRAEMTQIQARSNNPLKFCSDAGAGIEQLVQPATRGFLEGPAAMEDAMQDLVGHSIGTVSGMRAAIEGMLDRFDPAALESQLAGGSVLDSLVPMKRRSRLWELYLQHHRGIREEAQEDFHTLFGKAFVAAYEQQVERLKQRSKS